MLTNRKSFYNSVLVDDNKEIDLLDSSIQELIFDEDNSRTYIVSDPYIGRLDLISHQAYNTPELWWLLAYVNGIINPMEDMYTGQKLIIPNMIDYFNYYNRNKIKDTVDKIFSNRKLKQ